jgi:Ser/Thr protein kinase RdoA (MazF antagonist)
VTELTPDVPEILVEAWREYGDPRRLTAAQEISARVSTNRVYRLVLSDGKEYVAKVSSFGSFVHFRQDHQRIQEWSRLLVGGGFRNFLARVAERGGQAFVFKRERRWVAFYEKVGFYDFLPPILSDLEIAALGRNLAHFHRASLRAATSMGPTWKTAGSDIASLYDLLDAPEWRGDRGIGGKEEALLRRHCDLFLSSLESGPYYGWPKLPILIDWNIGNFSVGFDADGFKFYSRWDYDWFRMEPRMFDFYFASRVVREGGDQTVFSYTTGPLFEPRFIAFLRAYHAVFPLSEPEILFLEDGYRFFILNYVVHSGEHFFRPAIWQRLLRESLDTYLPSLDGIDFRPVAQAVLSP